MRISEIIPPFFCVGPSPFAKATGGKPFFGRGCGIPFFFAKYDDLFADFLEAEFHARLTFEKLSAVQ